MQPAAAELRLAPAVCGRRDPATARPGLCELTGGDTAIPCMSTDARSRGIVGREAPLEMLDRITQQMLTDRGRQIAFVTGTLKSARRPSSTWRWSGCRSRVSNCLCGRCTERFGTDEAFLPLQLTRWQPAAGLRIAQKLLVAIRTMHQPGCCTCRGSIDKRSGAALRREVFGATRKRMLREFCNLPGSAERHPAMGSRPGGSALEQLATVPVLSRFAHAPGKAKVLILGSFRRTDSAIGGHQYGGCIRIWRSTGAAPNWSRSIVPGRSRALSRVRFGDDALASTLTEPVFERTRGQPLSRRCSTT